MQTQFHEKAATMPARFTPLPDYPFIDAITEHEAQFRQEANLWYDTDYAFMSKSTLKRYKRMDLGRVAARMLPHTSRKECNTPLNRFTIWITIMDDYYELATKKNLEALRVRVADLLMGEKLTADDNGILHQVAKTRIELAPHVPDRWFERLVADMNSYIIYGMGGESPYKISRRIPPLAEFMIIREWSIGVHPYLHLVEVENDFILPEYVARHPTIHRLQDLISRLSGWQNDFYSLEKELAIDHEMMNLITVIRHEYDISLDEAYAEALRIHDADVAEFVAIHAALPDFGIYQQEVYKYVSYLGVLIQGLQKWYQLDTHRYDPDGFPKPEFGSSQID